MIQGRTGLVLLVCAVFVGLKLLLQDLPSLEDDSPGHSGSVGPASWTALRAQPSAELFKGEYVLRANDSVVLTGTARTTMGSQKVSVVGVQVSSVAVTLTSARRSGGRSKREEAEVLLRGIEFVGARRVTASGVADFAVFSELGLKRCRLDAVLQFYENPADEAPASLEMGEALRSDSSGVGSGRGGFVGDIASVDCGLSLHFTAEAIDVERIERKVMHYALWVNMLTIIQIRCFLSQMRYTDDGGPSAAKLSLVGIALQALMDAYDSFLHLGLSAASPNRFNTFAIISLSKFVLFALFEVRYLLTIWRQRNLEIFAEGWDTVRRELSRFYSYFYSALIGGLVLIFNSLDYLDLIALILQAYWVPQIIYDLREGSKNAFEPRFLATISVTRCLALFYMWGCPSSVFSVDLYPQLPHAPNLRLCAAALVLQGAQVAVMASQKAFGPRWFVPWICLPRVYNYTRQTSMPRSSECVICMGELVPDDRHSFVITPCDHGFHRPCLEQWMDIKMECPTCRATLPPIS